MHYKKKPLGVDPILERAMSCREAKGKSQNLFPFVKNGGKKNMEGHPYTFNCLVQSHLSISQSRGSSQTADISK